MNLIFSDERMPGQTIIDHMKNAAELCVREENLDPELIEISVTFVSTEEIHELNRYIAIMTVLQMSCPFLSIVV